MRSSARRTKLRLYSLPSSPRLLNDLGFILPPVALRCASDGRFLPRKEVIQPHLPVQLPCYDFVPVTSPTLGACLLAVSPATSSVTDFHDVTGGVYNPRERIHRSVLTCGY